MQLTPITEPPTDFPKRSDSSINLDRVLVIIPVLNEEATIATVINALKQLNLTRIRVVDNGSIDNSIAEAKKAGAEVILEPHKGYGRACWRGLQNISDCIEWILFCDGDGSDDLSELPLFFAQNNTDFILGNRRATSQGRSAMTPVQNFGNGLATFLIYLGWGYRYHDLGPLRLIRRSALEAIQMQDRGFGWTVEMQARAVELNLKIQEIPVNYHRRQGGRSKISGTLSGSLKAGTIILSTLGSLYIQRSFKTSENELISQQLFLTLSSSILLILGCILFLIYGTFQHIETVPQFWIGTTLMSLGFILSWKIQQIYSISFWLVCILSRLLLLPINPGTDVWRYLWEGLIQNLGFNPYLLPPNAPELEAFQTAWSVLINHADHAAIYPPLAELGFRVLAAITPSLLLFKLTFVGADLGICWLLSRRFGLTKTLLYAWNPLIIYSFAGTAHYDSWLILPLLASCLIFESRKWSFSAVLIGVSIAMKWVSLPILGLLAWLQLPRFRSAMMVFGLGILPLILSAIPFCSTDICPILPIGSSFASGRSAEFLPFIIDFFRGSQASSNLIYFTPLILLLILSLGSVHFRQHQHQGKSQPTFNDLLYLCEFYLISLLIVSPIIHPWYFTWLIPCAVVSRNLGTRLVSISAFVYFILPYRYASGDLSWYLTVNERLLMWIPFIFGCLWMVLKSPIFQSNVFKSRQ
ncbi:MAG: glycosyltransferase [Cyanobacteriota bacterium]|nr:glycosyltransferase [Cyanobacteriota bacterium]